MAGTAELAVGAQVARRWRLDVIGSVLAVQLAMVVEVPARVTVRWPAAPRRRRLTTLCATSLVVVVTCGGKEAPHG